MGVLDPTKLQAKVTTSHYHAGNMLAGSATTDYEIRDTSAHDFVLPIARATVAGNGATPTVDAPGRVIDMGIAISSTLTAGGSSVDAYVLLTALMDLSAIGGSADSASGNLFATEVGVNDLPNGGRFWFLPEISPSLTQTSTYRSFAVPELRAPIDAIRVRLQARSAPDAGAVSLRAIRRY